MGIGQRMQYAAIAAMLSGVLSVPVVAADKEPLQFTATQADQGKKLYDINCASCHGTKLEGTFGGPPLKDGAFRARFEPQPGDAVSRYIREKMPPSAPGTISESDAADLFAHILRINGAAPGKTPLPTDAKKLEAASLAKALPPLPARYKHVVPPNVKLSRDAIAENIIKARADRMQTLKPVTDEMLKNPPEGEWLNWRRTYDQHGFSPLKQINKSNVDKLQIAWGWKLQSSPNEITPLVHEGVLFVASGGRVQALDATTGDLLWQFFREGAPSHVRNIGIYGNKIYFASSDTFLTALDMHTGKMVWEKRFAAPEDQLRFSAGPLIVKGVVIQGMSGCHLGYPGGCYIVGLDAETGKELWRFYTLPRPGQAGGETWNNAPVDKRLGGSVWTTGSYDPDLNLAYFGVGQTYKISTLLKNYDGTPGGNDALYTGATLALRPDTGELVWFYQHVARDVWDLDWTFERTLITRNINGKPRRTVTTAGKLGIFDTLDAATGEYLGSYDPGLQNVVSAIDPKTGVKTISDKVQPEADVEKLVCPSSYGHRNWPSTSYNAATGILYAPMFDGCMPYKWTPNVDADIDIWLLPIHRPGSDGQLGQVRAINLAAGKTQWMERRRAMESSAILATAGDIIFEGSRDRWFRASDAKTGKVLWQVKLDGPPSAFPITYSVNGEQYVAVTTGGGNSIDANMSELTAEIASPSAGVTLWTFKLPKSK